MEASDRNAHLQEVIDHHAIHKLLSLYCHGCDRGDGALMASVYAENSWDDHGVYKGDGKKFALHVSRNAALGRLGTHLLGQSLININGDKAGAQTNFLAVITEKDETGRDILTQLGGRYVDTLIRENGVWKISNRVCVRDWSITLDVEKDTLRHRNFVQGQISGLDPSYAVLGLTHGGLFHSSLDGVERTPA